jgi:tRNA A-37 threonylcarbamoyl transferase component Bud32
MASLNPSFPLDRRDIYDIPRVEVISAATKAPLVFEGGGVIIARVHENAVLKFGREVRLSEAKNMRFARQFTTIWIPAVIDAWEVEAPEVGEDRGMGYLLMEYIEGSLVSDIWPTLDTQTRHSIYCQLDDSLRQLHAVKVAQPGPLGGDVSRGTLFTAYGAGPFKSSRDMETWFNERLLVCQEFGRAPRTQASFSGKFDKLVMCHLDIAPRNLILDGQGRVWILDWAYAGGYPPYFDQAVLMKSGDPDFTQGLLGLMGDENIEEVECLFAIGFALTTGAFTRPADLSMVTYQSH